MITLYLDASGNTVLAATKLGAPLPLGCNVADDRIHITEATYSEIRSTGVWTGLMPHPREIKDAAGKALYTSADVGAHANMLLKMTDWSAVSTSPSSIVSVTKAQRELLHTLKSADPATVKFPRISSWDLENAPSPGLAPAA